MPDLFDGPDVINEVNISAARPRAERYWLHGLLFCITFIMAMIAGLEWQSGIGVTELTRITRGLPYAVCIMAFLASHEFGHYFASRLHKVEASLPFFIPFYSFGVFLSFGTMGAVIKTRSYIPGRKALFDIGAAGPIAGFITCCIILAYGFSHLPPKDFILAIHPDYLSPTYGATGLKIEFGENLLFMLFRKLCAPANAFIPPMSEIYHYPYLCAGWFGLFVTAMNMLPVGQLDGGHIAYAMFGEGKHRKIALSCMAMLLVLGVSGIISLYLKWFQFGWPGWLFWGLILIFIIKIKHPAIYDPEPLGTGRMIAGIFAYLILILSYAPSPFPFSF